MSSTSEPQTQPLNIVFAADIIDGGQSGGVISARRIIDSLKKEHNLTLISTGEQEANKIVLPAFYLPLVKNIMQEMGFTFAWPNGKVLRKAFQDADVIHIQFPFLLGYRALYIARKMDIPVILGFHVQPENLMWNIGLKFDWLNSLLYRLFVGTFYNKGCAVLSPSGFAKTMLKKYGIDVPVEVISNGLPEQFKPGDHQPRPEFAGKFVILMVGRFAKEKRHDLVFQAIKQSPNAEHIQLVITGQGPLREELERQAAMLPNPALVDYVSQPELIRLYNTADLLIHASEVELEGMAVLEAIGCGLPALIANADSSAATQFALNDKFLFSDGDTQDLTAHIDYWYQHRDELAHSKPLYLEKARQFSFDYCVKKTVDLYRRTIAGASAKNRSPGKPLKIAS